MDEPSTDPTWLEYQRRMDEGNIRTLVILHRVYAGLMGLFSCCFGGYILVILGVAGVAASSPRGSNPPPPGIFAMIASLWGVVVVGFIVVVILNILAANWLRDRRNWIGVVVVSGINCLTGVLGVALAVFTLIMVNRPHIRETFQ